MGIDPSPKLDGSLGSYCLPTHLIINKKPNKPNPHKVTGTISNCYANDEPTRQNPKLSLNIQFAQSTQQLYGWDVRETGYNL